jgi:shikimate kinase
MNAIANPPAKAAFLPPRTIVIIGMPGAGKSSIGRKLAARLAIPFHDADSEIETAAGMSISQIFDRFGEEEFRLGERRVIARLLEQPVHVLATGGGAFMDPETRALIRGKGISVWLKADLPTLLTRTSRRDNRPLLKQGDPRDILQKLLATREPVYAEADVTVETNDRPTEETVDRMLEALRTRIATHS